MKEKGIAYILWAGCFVGLCGLHRLYTGRIGTGLLYLFTFGLVGIGQFVDLFAVPRLVDDANARLALEGVDPAALLAAGGAGRLLGRRVVPRTSEQFQVALVQAAEEHGGNLTVAEAVGATGRSFKDVKAQLDEMAVNGFIEMDSDDAGQVFYRFPGIGPDSAARG